MVDHSRQLQGVLCALALGIGVNALCHVRLSLAFILTSKLLKHACHTNLALTLRGQASSLIIC